MIKVKGQLGMGWGFREEGLGIIKFYAKANFMRYLYKTSQSLVLTKFNISNSHVSRSCSTIGRGQERVVEVQGV